MKRERVAESVVNSLDQKSLSVLILTFSPTIYLQPKIRHRNLKDIVRDKDFFFSSLT